MDERTWDSPYQMRGEEELQKIAAGRWCDLVVAEDDELLLDLDSDHALLQFYRMREEITDTARSQVAIVAWDLWRSQGGNRHVRVKLARPLEFTERIALQAILGSDPLREFLLLTEYMLCGESVNCLFRPKEAV